MGVAERIRYARKRIGWTQADVGFSVGASRQTISALERGIRQPTAVQLCRLATALYRSLGWFLEQGAIQPD